MTNKKPLLIFLLLGLCGFFAYLQFHAENTQPHAQINIPDQFAKDITLKQFGDDGLLQQSMRAETLRHFKDNTAKITKPVLTLYRQHQAPMTITSDTATVQDDNKKIILRGHVRLHQNDTADNPASTLLAEKLVYYPETKLAIATSKKQLVHYQTLSKDRREPMHAWGQEIRYIAPQNLMVLKGKAKLEQAKNSFTAPLIKYNVKTRHIVSQQVQQQGTVIKIYSDKSDDILKKVNL